MKIDTSWWGKPEYNGIKVLVLVALVGGLGYFLFNNINHSLINTGSVAQQGNISTTGIVPSVSVVSTLSASAITGTTAILNGKVGVVDAAYPQTATFTYGPKTTYGTTTQATIAADGTVSAKLTGLSKNTAYHYRFIVTNSVGTSAGADMTFTTTRAIK